MQIGPSRAGIPLHGGKDSGPESIADAARQLETQFAKLLISSMRTTSLGDSMFPGSSEHYRDMYDQQLATSLTRGKGLGLQAMIRQQLGERPDNARELFEKASQPFPLDGYKRLLPAQPSVARQPVAPQPALPFPIAQARPQVPSAVQAVGQIIDRVAAANTAPSVPATAKAASPTGDCDGEPKSNPRPGTPEAFVARIWPHAQRAAAELGVCPKMLVAQAALETGWGRHTIKGKDGEAHNLFGIKASGSWRGAAVTNTTREFVNGTEVRENAAFRAYRSIADSFSDYVSLLKNTPRYAAAIGQSTGRAFASALQSAGYATDPQYAAKLTAIAEGPTLNRALARIDGPAA